MVGLPHVYLDAGCPCKHSPSQYTAAIPIRPIGLNTSLSFRGLSVSPRNKNSAAPLTVQVPKLFGMKLNLTMSH
jgi:hypothetical protein